MPKTKSHSRTLFFLYALATYIVVQLFYWVFMLVDLHTAIFDQQQLIEALSPHNLENAFSADFLRRKTFMVIGESAVFVVIVVLAVRKIIVLLRKELLVAQQQQNFLLSVTHELKTPLASSRLFLQTLLGRKQLEEQQQRDIYNKLIKDNDRLTQLVENILTATNIEQGNLNPNKQLFDLSSTAEQVFEHLAPTVGAKHHCTCDIAPNIEISGDTQLFESILTNLFENACKYSNPGTTVELKLQRKGDQIELHLLDEGPGIQDKKRIFHRFYREGNEHVRQSKGTGLGLYIVHQLCRISGWKISVEDNTPKGSNFILKFNTK